MNFVVQIRDWLGVLFWLYLLKNSIKFELIKTILLWSQGCANSSIIGPSGVRALPLVAGINVGGHYTWHYFSSLFSLSESLTFLPERRQLGF